MKDYFKINEDFTDSITTKEQEGIISNTLSIINKLSKILIPKRVDIKPIVLKMGSNSNESLIKIDTKLICLPIIYDNNINNLELKFNRILPLLLLNQYKFLMLKDIYDKLDEIIDCDVLVKWLDLTIKTVIDVCDGDSLYKFLKLLKSPPSIPDIYTIMDELNINVLIYNLSETVIYNKKNDWNSPLLVFKYRSDTDLDYIGFYENIYRFQPEIMQTIQYLQQTNRRECITYQ